MIGKKTRKWLRFRKKFLEGKENHEGYYICEICGRWTKEPEVDHTRKRSLAPERIFDKTNLRILCYKCHIKVNPDYETKKDRN